MGSNQYNALLINDSSVGTDQTVRYVLVVGADNKVQYRPVKLGPIIDGLARCDRRPQGRRNHRGQRPAARASRLAGNARERSDG